MRSLIIIKYVQLVEDIRWTNVWNIPSIANLIWFINFVSSLETPILYHGSMKSRIIKSRVVSRTVKNLLNSERSFSVSIDLGLNNGSVWFNGLINLWWNISLSFSSSSEVISSFNWGYCDVICDIDAYLLRILWLYAFLRACCVQIIPMKMLKSKSC